MREHPNPHNMTSHPIKVLWIHESIRRRPGLFVELAEGQAGQARGLIEHALTRLSSPRFGNEASRVELRVWPGPPGPAFELQDDGRGWPLDVISVAGAPMSRIDRVMTEFHLEPDETYRAVRQPEPEPEPQVWGPFGGVGVILNALCSRVTIQTARDGVRVAARYSRGGIIAPVHPSSHGPSRGTRVIFEFDPLLFDAATQAHVSSKEVLEELVSRHPSATVEWVPDYPLGAYPPW
ncbi:hypothetical protein [Archangium lansingense]|uniref:Histidine kinase/HSP90-like ATPase domain-containing protein n=1 Tax=Archangium lansingense TaxID=2995310 RepID=A0ABT4A930_9BACT|nr:hypothetical protein [Archangium lansinium]MCY1077469.1 hypothetical protein [Archangium lansinium]